MLEIFKNVAHNLLDLFIPALCPLCSRKLDSEHFCQNCESQITTIETPYCIKCGKPLFENEKGNYCGRCLSSKLFYNKIRSYGHYDGTLKDAIKKFKFGHDYILKQPLGKTICKTPDLDFKIYDFIIPVPLHKSRTRERGFNQSLLLARHISKEYKIPLDYKNLVKIKDTSDQATLAFRERLKNISKDTFRLNNTHLFRGKNVLVVDDVVTTGTTLNVISKLLKKKGKAKNVDCVTVARTV